jgi:hypothetical protein
MLKQNEIRRGFRRIRQAEKDKERYAVIKTAFSEKYVAIRAIIWYYRY